MGEGPCVASARKFGLHLRFCRRGQAVRLAAAAPGCCCWLLPSLVESLISVAATSAASASHARPPVSQPGGQPASGPVNQSTRALACHPQSEMSGFDCRQSEAVQSLAQSSLTPVDGLTVQPPAAQIRHRLTLTPAKPSSFPSPPPSIHIVLDLNVAAIASRTTRSIRTIHLYQPLRV